VSCDDILLHIQGYPETTRPAIDAAVTLAKGLSGRISALAVELSVASMPNQLVDRLLGLGAIAKEMQARSAEGCRAGIDHFRSQAAAAGVLQDTEMLSADMGLEALRRAREARAFDFSIYCPPAEDLDKVLAETLILLSGRPVLILPDGHKGVLDRVVVAWDGSPAATRAMNDALPLLQAARSVKVVTVSGDKPVDRSAPLAQAVRHLQRHGVRAEGKEVEPEGLSTEMVLERHLKAQRADVMVMGAFGHSRLREIVLGGVTEHMLSHTPAAVWLSH
jgi:nucleotide-binding universal stress UspA family protein